VLSTSAGAATGSKAYLIGSRSPLTQAQTQALKDVGAQLTGVYRNFGGAAAVIPDSKLSAVRSLSFVISVNPDTVRQLDAVSPPAGTTALPGRPYWQDLIDAEHNTAYTGSGVWVAVLDSGFYPNWRDYFVESDVLTQYARAFIAAGGNQNAATITGYKLVDDTNEGGWGVGYATGKPGTYGIPGVAPSAKVIPVKVCEPIGCFGSAINAGVDYVTSLKKANPSRPIVTARSSGGGSVCAGEAGKRGISAPTSTNGR
jgi:hypothetical protein